MVLSTSTQIQAYYDTQYGFAEVFNRETGFYMRSDDSFMRSFANLIDIGIMGHCEHAKTGQCLKAGVQCYQGGSAIVQPNMSMKNYQRIIDECEGKVMQIALGGRGDPNLHEKFPEILGYTRAHGIVPNYTTSGMGLTDEQIALSKEHCGAVAVSWYGADYTIDAIERLIEAGVTTNIHYVLNKTTLVDAWERLGMEDGFPEGINAVIFLLHKPVGLGQLSEVLPPDGRIESFFSDIEHAEFPYKIGFDACSIPGLVRFTDLPAQFFDTCEGARFSMYITPDMVATPCSFDQGLRYGFDLANGTIQDAWDSPQFEQFRDKLRNSCPGCGDRAACMGGCPLHPEIVLCNSLERLGVIRSDKDEG